MSRSKEIIAESEDETQIITTSIRFPEDLYRRFKAILALNGDTMQAVIEDFVRDYVSSNSP